MKRFIEGEDRNQSTLFPNVLLITLQKTTPSGSLMYSLMDLIADAGYFKRADILSCHEAGITANVPRPQTSGNQAKGLFRREDFHYVPEKDEYRCPANERLIWRMTSEEKGLKIHRYWSSNYKTCSMKSLCTRGRERRVTRWEHEAILEAMQDRLDSDPEIMRVRRQTVEHPYGTL